MTALYSCFPCCEVETIFYLWSYRVIELLLYEALDFQYFIVSNVGSVGRTESVKSLVQHDWHGLKLLFSL